MAVMATAMLAAPARRAHAASVVAPRTAPTVEVAGVADATASSSGRSGRGGVRFTAADVATQDQQLLLRDRSTSAAAGPTSSRTSSSLSGRVGMVPEELRGALPQITEGLTSGQVWRLISEGHVESVRVGEDSKSLSVALRAGAPGGARVEEVWMPFGEELLDHCLAHSVLVHHIEISPAHEQLFPLARMVLPTFLAVYGYRKLSRMKQKQKRDKLFGGAKLDKTTGRDTQTTFEDIAGVDEVKAEIMELVQFLRDPERFLAMGCRTPAGVLMVGPPGVGKTLLAKAIAGEARVPFFSVSGTEFTEMYVGVGAARVRDMFEKARRTAPCILFIDEFDGVGLQRSSTGNDESVQTINQLLTEMDGFEDNTGIVVMAATNRPGALDDALVRPGRFDRVLHLPHPNLAGRVDVLKVHARGKPISDALSFQRIARATAGFSGAELMDLMERSSAEAINMGHDSIMEEDVFESLEKIQLEKASVLQESDFEEDVASPQMRKLLAVYQAGHALLGCMMPQYDELIKVSVCSGGLTDAYSYFIPREEHLESRILTRAYLEARIAVSLAGRCAEKLVLGEDTLSTLGARDVRIASVTAREAILRCGFSQHLGDATLLNVEDYQIKGPGNMPVSDASKPLASVAASEIRQLLDAAEAKAMFCLLVNYDCLQQLTEELLLHETLGGNQVRAILEEGGAMPLPDSALFGFGWDDHGHLLYPRDYPGVSPEFEERYCTLVQQAEAAQRPVLETLHPMNPFRGPFPGRFPVRMTKGIVDTSRIQPFLDRAQASEAERASSGQASSG